MVPFDQELRSIKETGAAFTAAEIAGQPDLWLKIFRQIRDDNERIADFLNKALPDISRVILTGAGTSAYIGLTLHGAFSRSLGVHSDAIATTDLVSHPTNYFLGHESIILVSFARSGNSPESSAVVELADQLSRKCYHIVITCDPEGKLARYNTKTSKLLIVLPPEANDKSLAMTSSYSGMLLTGFLLTKLKKLDKMETEIELLCAYGRKILNFYGPKLKEIAGIDFKRVVFLGSGPLYGTATESNLKLQELTDGNIICKNHSYLGFRHGPKAVTNGETLVVYIFSNNPFVMQYERDLVISMKKGKKPLFTIAISETALDGFDFDLPVILSDSGKHLEEELLAVSMIIPALLLGLFKSLALGLSPDSPSESGAISRVVEDVTIYRL